MSVYIYRCNPSPLYFDENARQASIHTSRAHLSLTEANSRGHRSKHKEGGRERGSCTGAGATVVSDLGE